jgi:hypothetical protein
MNAPWQHVGRIRGWSGPQGMQRTQLGRRQRLLHTISSSALAVPVVGRLQQVFAMMKHVDLQHL